MIFFILDTVFLVWIFKFGGAEFLEGGAFGWFYGYGWVDWSADQIKLCTAIVWALHLVFLLGSAFIRVFII